MKSSALGNTGLALTTLGELAEAQSKFETVLTLTQYPETKARALNNIGELLQKQGEFYAARTHYEEALRLTMNEDLRGLINKYLAELNPFFD